MDDLSKNEISDEIKTYLDCAKILLAVAEASSGEVKAHLETHARDELQEVFKLICAR